MENPLPDVAFGRHASCIMVDIRLFFLSPYNVRLIVIIVLYFSLELIVNLSVPLWYLMKISLAFLAQL